MSKLTGAKKEAIKKRLAELEKKGKGILTPQAVVEDARDPKSPLHGQFNWDVSKAAYEYWLDQARALIVSVRYVYKTEKTVVKAVFYHRNPDAAGTEPGYVSIPTLRSDEDMSRSALIDAFRRIGDELRRARQLAVALDLDREVEQLLNGVMDLRRKFGDEPRAPMQ